MVKIARVAVLVVTCGAAPSCDSDSNSLLQTTSAVRKPNLAPQLAEAEALLQTVRGVAHKLQNSQMTPEEANAAIGTAQNALHDLEPTFAEQLAISQHEADTQYAEIQTCEGRSEMAHHHEAVETRHAATVECAEAHAEAVATETRECEAWTSLAEGLYDGIPDCDRPSSPGQLFDIVNGWADFVQSNRESLTSQRRRCHEARDAETDQAQVCAAMNDAFVDAFCERKIACEHTFVGCYEDEVEVYNSLRQDIESQVDTLRLQYITVRQADCILELITTALVSGTPIDHDSLTACDNVDASALQVTFRDPPPAPECPASDSDPNCDAPFGMSHSSWGQFTNVDDFQRSTVAWVDRAYVYRHIPEEIQGATLFSGPVKRLNNGHLNFHTNHHATLYVWSEVNRRHGGLASLGWEPCANADDFRWASIGSSCSGCNGDLGCWKREVDAMEDVAIPLTSTWVGGAAAKLTYSHSD